MNMNEKIDFAEKILREDYSFIGDNNPKEKHVAFAIKRDGDDILVYNADPGVDTFYWLNELSRIANCLNLSCYISNEKIEFGKDEFNNPLYINRIVGRIY